MYETDKHVTFLEMHLNIIHVVLNASLILYTPTLTKISLVKAYLKYIASILTLYF